MRYLSFKIIYFLLAQILIAQSPHGKELKLDCSVCHQSTSWKVDIEKMQFDHKTTKFELLGTHKLLDCKSCHQSLIFYDASSDCHSCHIDVHQNSVGLDCSRCHTTENWLVKDIYKIHQLSRFPLLGAHKTANCNQCHLNFNVLKFDLLNIDCISCHRNDYYRTTNPNHLTAGFTTECLDCHDLGSLDWKASNFNHNFFQLIGKHSQVKCISCHSNVYRGTSKECFACHQNDYNRSLNPNHLISQFPKTCQDCHDFFGWRPSTFNHDAQYFPIYSGEHRNQWNSCSDCHKVPGNFTIFSCIDCHAHRKSEMDEKHRRVQNYFYESRACFSCHPDGRKGN